MEKTKKKGLKSFIVRRKNTIVVSALCLAMLVSGSAIVTARVNESSPYAIKVGGETLCYVTSKGSADAVMRKTVEACQADDTTLKAMKTDGDFTVEKVENGEAGKDDTIKVDDAVKAVTDKAKESDDFSVVVASSKTEIQTFTPEPNYEKDDDMFAGEEVVKVEGKDGKKKVITTVTTVDGKVAKEEVESTEILDEGSKATIVRGTLGLPEGEDWKTYDGDPVFNDADDLIKTCKKYIGAPYKYGGKSLTNGIDCVQYVRQMFAKYGIYIPNKHSQIQKVGKGVSLANAQPGDIVCWSHHVGIYIGNGKVINATRKKGVTISSVHMKKKLITVRRVPRN